MSEAGVSAPIMPSRDLDATIAYYARLGFEIWGERMEDYILLRRGSWELHFFLWPEHDPAACYCAVYRRGEDVDELSQY